MRRFRFVVFRCGISGVMLCLLIAIACGSGAAILTAGSPRRVPVYAVATQEKKIALTFDAAWGNSDTGELIDLLAEQNAKATFFTTGDWIERFPDDVKALAAAGHLIGNHSDQHPHVASISAKDLRADTEACAARIEALLGEQPTYYRAPYGEYDNEMLTLLEDEMGYQVIQWDVDSRDWQGKTAEEMAESVLSSVQAGSILLFHNDVEQTPQALRLILPALAAEGYAFVRVDELVLQQPYTIDSNGVQHAGK